MLRGSCSTCCRIGVYAATGKQKSANRNPKCCVNICIKTCANITTEKGQIFAEKFILSVLAKEETCLSRLTGEILRVRVINVCPVWAASTCRVSNCTYCIVLSNCTCKVCVVCSFDGLILEWWLNICWTLGLPAGLYLSLFLFFFLSLSYSKSWKSPASGHGRDSGHHRCSASPAKN